MKIFLKEVIDLIWKSEPKLDEKFHSYVCNSLEEDYKLRFGFTLNENGFIDSLEQAIVYCKYSNEKETGTEPVFWLPWGVFEYKD
jgi:hypothetical protein